MIDIISATLIEVILKSIAFEQDLREGVMNMLMN